MTIQMMALNSKHRTNRNERKHRKATKTSFPIEWVEKAVREKPVLNKIMTTHN